jgi:hypothetical protein
LWKVRLFASGGQSFLFLQPPASPIFATQKLPG